MKRTEKDIYALIQKGERLHAECKEAFGGSDDCLALAGALAFAKMDLEEYKAWKFGPKAGGQKLLNA